MNIITANMYDQYRKSLFTGSASDFTGLSLKLALVTSTYTVDQNLDEFWADVEAHEVSGDDYTAGGNSCINPTVAMNVAGLVTMNADDPPVWPQSLTGFSNAYRAVLYIDTGDSATSRLIMYGDPFPAVGGNTTGPYACAFAGTGIFTIPRGN